jgi:glycosyltransferase involved in cell wall biosynthesis
LAVLALENDAMVFFFQGHCPVTPLVWTLTKTENIPFKNVTYRDKIHRIFAVRNAIREKNPDVVIAFLNVPSLIAELGGLPLRKYTLIVSERNVEPFGLTMKSLTRFACHAMADAVVSNSFAKTKFIIKNAPWLRKKAKTITNCVDLDKFRPLTFEDCTGDYAVHLVVVGRFESQKNPMALLSALEILKRDHPQVNVVVDWYGNNFFSNGRPSPKSWLYLELKNRICECGFREIFRLHQPSQNVVDVYRKSSVVCLPSLWEGCSNVIGEAMACGKPILASRVGDNEVLVKDGENGILFDPKLPQDIAAAILRFASLSPEERGRMGDRSRHRAEQLLSPSVFVEKYIELIEEIRG